VLPALQKVGSVDGQEHAPPEQLCAEAHATPPAPAQPPQFSLSVLGLTQDDPQSMVPAAHVHCPPRHTDPGLSLQVMPQPPQLLPSVCVSTHCPPCPLRAQKVWPTSRQVVWHLAPEHAGIVPCGPMGHAYSQLPQLSGSDWRFTHPLGQAVHAPEPPPEPLPEPPLDPPEPPLDAPPEPEEVDASLVPPSADNMPPDQVPFAALQIDSHVARLPE